MFEKKQMLPLGSKVTVCYALDGGTETVLVVVGHLSLRNRNACYYDYICVDCFELSKSAELLTSVFA